LGFRECTHVQLHQIIHLPSYRTESVQLSIFLATESFISDGRITLKLNVFLWVADYAVNVQIKLPSDVCANVIIDTLGLDSQIVTFGTS